MLIEFEKWFQTMKQEIKNVGYQIETTKISTSEGDCIKIDFDSESKMARITLWDLNQCSLEIIDIDSGSTVFDELLEIHSSSDFDKTFTPFFNILKLKND